MDHGGPLTIGIDGRRVEAVMVSKDELRLYLTTTLCRVSDKAKGSVELWTDEMMENTLVKVDLVPAPSGTYLAAKIPANMILPLRARCTLDLGESAAYLVDFFLPEIVEVTIA
jgi:hypothetical protein